MIEPRRKFFFRVSGQELFGELSDSSNCALAFGYTNEF